MVTKTPDYLTYGDGFCDIGLTRGLNIGGAKVMVMRMREPDLNDQLALDAMEGSDALKEVKYMANLCQVAPDELRSLKLRDYGRVQKGFAGFLD